MPTNSCLDHAVINVKHEMDGAAPLFKTLGFSLTPRGFHSHGSMNHLMVFESNYLELIGIPKGQKIERQDLMDAPIGINGIVFKATDINEIYSRIEAAGFNGDLPRAFHRPVEIDGEQKKAKFKTVTVRGDIFPGGRVYYCQHGTPEMIWRPEWQDHSNGVTSIKEFITVARQADGEAERFGTLLGTDAKLDGNGARYIVLGSSRLTILTPEQYSIRYGDLASPLEGDKSIFGAIVFTTNALPALNDLLKEANNIISKRYPSRYMVRIPSYNTVLEFVGIEPV